MKAAWYEKQGTAREVLVVGEMADPFPAAGEIRIRIAASGVNPGELSLCCEYLEAPTLRQAR